MTTTIENVHASLQNFCKRFAEAMNVQLGYDLDNIDFEAFTEESEMPLKDLVGITNLSVEVDEHVLNIECLVGVVTYGDTNNFRLRKLSGMLFEELKPTRCLPYMDADTGVVSNQFSVLNGTKMMPVSGGERPARFFIVRLKSLETIDLRSTGVL